MIRIIQIWLLIYGIMDYSLQVIGQLPVIELHENMRYLGFRKIWGYDHAEHSADQIFSYEHFLASIGTGEKVTLELDYQNLFL